MILGISAVVATLNRKNELQRLFDSMLSSNISALEVIVVDQNVNGLIDDLINDYSDKLNIRHERMQEANQSKARNYGASLASHPILCFPDDDSWFERNALNDVQLFFDDKPSTDLLVIHWKQNPVQGIPSGYLSKKFIYSFKAVGYATYVLFFNRDKFLFLGGFIETIGIGKYVGGGEDSEIMFRAAESNFVIYFDASIHINHIYISIYQRDIPIIRARQRAMGLMYYLYPVGTRVIFRGLLSPLIKILGSGNKVEAKKHYNVFVGRLQGFFYGFKNKKKIFQPYL